MIHREPDHRRAQPLVAALVPPDSSRTPIPRDEFGNLTVPQTLEPRVLAERVNAYDERAYWYILNGDTGKPDPRLFGTPGQRRYEVGPVYHFKERPELSVFTLLFDAAGHTVGIRVLVHDDRHAGVFSGVRSGYVNPYSGDYAFDVSGSIAIDPSSRGGGLAAYTELAWIALLSKMALITNRPGSKHIVNENSDNANALRTFLLTEDSRNKVAIDVYRERIARKDLEQRGWQHLWGTSGLFGVHAGELRIDPDPAMRPATQGRCVILGKRMVHDPWSGREVLRPNVLSIEPSDAIDKTRVERELAELLENTKNRFFPKS